MPTKRKSGFLMFMEKRRSEMLSSQDDLARSSISLAEMCPLVADEWEALSEEGKQVYKDMATAENERLRAQRGLPPSKPPSSDSKKGRRSKYEEEDSLNFEEIAEAKAEIAELVSGNSSVNLPILVIKFAVYEEAAGNFWSGPILPAEVGLCAFSIKMGVFDNYACLIDPRVPEGKNMKDYTISARQMALPLPGYDGRLQQYHRMFKDLEYFIHAHTQGFYKTPVMFCCAIEVRQTKACMDWIFNQIGTGFDYKLFPLELLILSICNRQYIEKKSDEITITIENLNLNSSSSPGPSNPIPEKNITWKTFVEAVKKGPPKTSNIDSNLRIKPPVQLCSITPAPFPQNLKSDGKKAKQKADFEAAIAEKNRIVGRMITYPPEFPCIKEGFFTSLPQIQAYLNADNYAYYEELACLYHMKRGDGVSYCALNYANRIAFSLLDCLVISFGVTPRIGFHYPNVESSEQESDRRKEMLVRWVFANYNELARLQKQMDLELDPEYMQPQPRVPDDYDYEFEIRKRDARIAK